MKRASSRKVGTVELPLEKRPLADLGFVLLMQRGGLQLNRLRELESNGKLSASGFIRASLKFAETDNMQLDMVAEKLAGKPGTDHIWAFVQKLAKRISQSEWPSLPIAKAHRLPGAFGRDGIEHQMSMHGVNVQIALALAVRHAVKQWPDRFGPVEDADVYKSTCAALRAELEQIYALMRSTITSADMLIETRTLTEDQKKSGLSRTRVRWWPRIVVGSDRWPEECVEAEAARMRGEKAPPVVEDQEPVPPVAVIADSSMVRMNRTHGSIADEFGPPLTP